MLNKHDFSQPAKKFLSRLRYKSKTFLNLARKGVFAVLSFQTRQSNKALRSVAAGIVSFVFLFVRPNTGAQTVIVDTVLPSVQPAFVTIQDSVGSVQLPDFSVPVHGYLSTRFSFRHQGIDVPNPYGTSVKAVAEGEVTFASWSPFGYGKLVTIRHEAGFESLYAHLSEISVVVGQKVTHETVIGRVGSTGVATGAHLHLEVHFDGKPVDPLLYISLENLLGN